jgi:hypothetical protein
VAAVPGARTENAFNLHSAYRTPFLGLRVFACRLFAGWSSTPGHGGHIQIPQQKPKRKESQPEFILPALKAAMRAK